VAKNFEWHAGIAVRPLPGQTAGVHRLKKKGSGMGEKRIEKTVHSGQPDPKACKNKGRSIVSPHSREGEEARTRRKKNTKCRVQVRQKAGKAVLDGGVVKEGGASGRDAGM